MSTIPTTSERTLPSGGWFWLDNSLLDRYGPQLGVYGLAVYLALARCADRQRECHPSYRTIAHSVGCSRRQVIREMQRLESLGLVEKIGRASDWGDPSANGYRLRCLSDPLPETLRGGDWQSPVVTDTPCTGDSVSPLVTESHCPGDSQSLEVVTGTTGGGDWQSPKQDLKNNTQEEENPTNKQTPQASEREDDVDATPVAGGSVLFSSSVAEENLPALPGEKAATAATPAGAMEEMEQEETLPEPPAAAYSLARFVQVTGCQPSSQERGQLAGLDCRYSLAELCYLFDGLESAQEREPVRNPLAYLRGIAQRQERGRWPGLALAARSQPETDPGRYALPVGYVSHLLAPAEEKAAEKQRPELVEGPPALFRRFVDELGRELYGSPMAAELRRLSPLAWDGDTLRIGVPEERLTAWLQERATPVVRRVKQRVSQAQGQAVRVEFAWVGGRCAPAAAG